MLTSTIEKISISTVNVLDIPIFNGDIETLYSIILKQIASGEKSNHQISLCDANVFISSKKDSELKDILLNNTFINLPDGMPGVWIGKLKGAKNIDRCYGPDVFDYVMRQSSTLEINHYFSGGKEGVAEKLSAYCSEEFNNNNIVGTHCPPFRDLTDIEIQGIAEEINSKKVDILWIGISSPKQDKYAQRLAKYLNVHFIFTVGAAFDFFTGNVKQAPRFIQRSGFEWLFRLSMEPRRLGKRYLNVIPRFIYYNILNLLGH